MTAPGSSGAAGASGALGAEQADALVRAAAPYATAVTLALSHGERQAVHCHGRLSHGGPPCTPDSVFEVGSVSKTFTALLLAVMAAHGTVALSDPVERHLPEHWRPAAVRSGGPIRLLHLATHTSGLPRLPPGLLAHAVPTWFSNPYAGYRDEQLMASLARTTVRHRPGSRFRYSNYGVGLLGRLLASAGGGPYPALLDRLVCDPLGLTATGCSPDAAPDRAVGHRRGQPLPPWRIPGLPGAGAVHSSGTDLLRYLRAHLAGPDGPLGEALRSVQHPRLRPPHSTDRLGLVWNHRRVAGRDLLFHAGATRGCTAFVAFCPQTATALAALANTAPTLDGRFTQAAYQAFRDLTVS